VRINYCARSADWGHPDRHLVRNRKSEIDVYSQTAPTRRILRTPGWRAFAQPGLQRRHSPLAATTVLGLLVAFWHLPLWLLPQFGATPTDIASDFIGTIAVTFWYAWLFNHSGGSALITIISHAVEGTIHPQQFWTDPAAAATTTWLYSAVWCVVAAVILIVDQKFWRFGSHSETAPTPSSRAEARA
jgi:uncharacterized protein